MLSPIHQIRSKGRQLSEEDIPQLHYDFMVCYGWIPLEEFKALPMSMMLTLWDKVQDEKRKREQFMVNVMSGLGAKGEHIRKWRDGS